MPPLPIGILYVCRPPRDDIANTSYRLLLAVLHIKPNLRKLHAEAPWFLMAPWNNAHGKPSLSAALSHTFAARSEDIDIKGKTVAGIVFALCDYLTGK
jgi:hypothetical protein